MRRAQDAFRTAALGFKAGHAGADAEFLGEPVGGDHDAVTAPTAADPDRLLLQLGIQRDLAAGEKAVAVDVQDAVGWFHLAPVNLARHPDLPRKQFKNSYSHGQRLSYPACHATPHEKQK